MCAYIEEYASVDVLLLVLVLFAIRKSLSSSSIFFCIALYVSIELRVGLSFSSEFE